ncbi:CLUMA_CG006997, isoform A [Clunio marinus]|uniref:CLUMA_CG006997, isoform A n=1 Tax=Clunio marinus TaxID=568069 RepID=A0A1J1HZL1_9DIPT|nr:CLUMA_CG006997, isoform A [Clunio marinus]
MSITLNEKSCVTIQNTKSLISLIMTSINYILILLVVAVCVAVVPVTEAFIIINGQPFADALNGIARLLQQLGILPRNNFKDED